MSAKRTRRRPAAKQSDREVNGKLSFNEYHDVLGRVFDTLETEARALFRKGLTEQEVDETIKQCFYNWEAYTIAADEFDEEAR